MLDLACIKACPRIIVWFVIIETVCVGVCWGNSRGTPRIFKNLRKKAGRFPIFRNYF